MTCLKHLVLDHPTGLFLLNFHFNALLSIFILSILFTWPPHYECFQLHIWNRIFVTVNTAIHVRVITRLFTLMLNTTCFDLYWVIIRYISVYISYSNVSNLIITLTWNAVLTVTNIMFRMTCNRMQYVKIHVWKFHFLICHPLLSC
jgi:hypothetical protein